MAQFDKIFKENDSSISVCKSRVLPEYVWVPSSANVLHLLGSIKDFQAGHPLASAHSHQSVKVIDGTENFFRQKRDNFIT